MNKKKTIIFDRHARTESFKRPDHPDFHTAAEHKANKFTGVRKNDMGMRWEFWILGKIEKEVTYAEIAADPQAVTKAHIELFHMRPEKGLFDRS